MIGIYKITNELNNKCYIGQSINIETRWLQHIYEGKHNTQKGKLYPAMYIDGIEHFIFEVIEECQLVKEELDNRERYWINYYDSFNNGYNSTLGGQGEDSWRYNPVLIRQLWDEGYTTGEITRIVGCGHTTVNNRLRGYKDFNTFTSHQRSCGSEARKNWNIDKNKSYHLTSNQALYFSEVVTVYQYSIDGNFIAQYPSIEAAAKAVNGKYPSAIGEASLGKNNRQLAYGYQWRREFIEKLPPIPITRGKLVKCLETNQIFHSTKEAAQWCELKSSSPIRDYCRGYGNYQSAGKHPITGEKLHWEYIE